MLKIGLTQRVDVSSSYAERRDGLDQAWARLLTKMGALALPLANCGCSPSTVLDHLKLDGIIFTGGNDLAGTSNGVSVALERDEFEAGLLRACGDRLVPILGVCRGMQLIASYYGLNITPVFNHVAVRHGIDIYENGAMPITPRSSVNSFHRFGIARQDVRGPIQVEATAPEGSVEAISHVSLPQWGIMWHPERAPWDIADINLLRACFDRRLA